MSLNPVVLGGAVIRPRRCPSCGCVPSPSPNRPSALGPYGPNNKTALRAKRCVASGMGGLPTCSCNSPFPHSHPPRSPLPRSPPSPSPVPLLPLNPVAPLPPPPPCRSHTAVITRVILLSKPALGPPLTFIEPSEVSGQSACLRKISVWQSWANLADEDKL